jgi:hypothetical protein
MRKKLRSEPIDGYTYEVTQLPAREGRRILVQLMKILAPTLGALLKNADTDKLDNIDLTNVDLEGAARALSEAADVRVFDELSDSMASATEVWGAGFGDAGAPLTHHFDDHFAGRYAAMLRWLGFALKANFADFFVGKGSVKKLVESLRSPGAGSGSPST